MESLELPLDMLWATSAMPKEEPVSPLGAGKCFIDDDPFMSNADELWPIDDEEEDNLLSYFDVDEEKLAITTATTIGYKKTDNFDDSKDEKLSSAEDLLQELIELKEEGQWMNQENVDLSTLTGDIESASSANFRSPLGSLYPEAAASFFSVPVTPAVSPPRETGGAIMTTNFVAMENNGKSTNEAAEILFNEIKNFCSDFEATYQHPQLTPPQSPPPTNLNVSFNQTQTSSSSMYAPVMVQKANIGNYAVDAPNLIALNAFRCEERSFVDLQLTANGCLDQTFVFPSNDDVQVATLNTPAPMQALTQEDDAIAEVEALAIIDELLRNKTKELHENYVLVDTSTSSCSSGASSPTFSCASVGQMATQDRATKRLRGSNEAAAQAIASIKLQQVTDDGDMMMMDYSDDSATQFSIPSYGNSLASSPSRSGSPQIDSQDEDWLPEADAEPHKPKKAKLKGSSASSTVDSARPPKRRPYERGGGEVEKKSRKKEQNKNAATRYRQKKKQEVETILEEETRLKKVNKKLVSQFNDAKREMKYLKNLLRDMYRKNNIII